ncbi:MAG: hypothetical protein HY296_02780 [Thaumarchaeota archaeon]|nr:hypothetical protein [Nitrososphaerota archaeon]
MTVPPNQRQTLEITIRILDVTKIPPGTTPQLSGTVKADLIPFASITVGVDYGSLVNAGGP